MKIERYYCDFCGAEITENMKHKDFRMSGEIVISKNNQQWSISSFENCHNCFSKVYDYVKDLKQERQIVISQKINQNTNPIIGK